MASGDLGSMRFADQPDSNVWKSIHRVPIYDASRALLRERHEQPERTRRRTDR
jgi:hypothetical protein